MRKSPARGRAALGFGILLAAALPAITGRAAAPQSANIPAQERIQLPEKEEITLVVTDSGLGGLSIMADTAARMKRAGFAAKVRLVFINALFSGDSGYNSLRTRTDQSLVFDSALRSMQRMVSPDVIVIGCNTLSVVYGDTAFAKASHVPVVRILNPGIQQFRQALERNPGASIVLFGTETTISGGTHGKALAGGGIAESRIIAKACPELAAYIENDWRGDETRFLIASYVDEALAALPAPRPPLFAGLVCTHYGYAQDLWRTAFQENGIQLLGILNPNEVLVDALVASRSPRRHKNTAIEAQVISMVEIPAARRNSLGAWLARVSPEVAAALAHYQLRPDLFEWKPLVTK